MEASTDSLACALRPDLRKRSQPNSSFGRTSHSWTSSSGCPLPLLRLRDGLPAIQTSPSVATHRVPRTTCPPASDAARVSSATAPSPSRSPSPAAGASGITRVVALGASLPVVPNQTQSEKHPNPPDVPVVGASTPRTCRSCRTRSSDLWSRL